jgi:TetR/AcrR family transcriptional regulator, regulator of autoinduction and epiphytic fitness
MSSAVLTTEEHVTSISPIIDEQSIDRVGSRASVDAPGDSAKADGRRVRRTRNVASVVEALIALFHEGEVHPTAQQLADRSGVSLRSVFRYFDDMQDLVVRAIELHVARCEPLFRLPAQPPLASLDERIARIAAHRVRLYFALAPIVRAARVRQHELPAVAELAAERRQLLQDQTEAWFAPELGRAALDERPVVLGCLDTALQFESAEHLDLRMGLDPDAIERAFRLSASRILAPLG